MDNEEEKQDEQEQPNTENLTPIGVITPEKSKHKVFCLNIIGHVEGHALLSPQQKTTKYEHVIPQLTLVEEDDTIEGLLVTLNTVGGDVEAGLAIAEMISTMGKPTVSLIIGGGHSIGVPLATSSNYSFIAQSATMTLHPIRMTGLVIGASQTYEYFDKVQQQVMRFIERNSKIKYAELKKLMNATGQISNDVGTILFGHEAVEKGIIDSVGGIREAFDKLYEMIEKKKKRRKK
ncbi:MAG: ATP-dependent Clp protease proteolytic subunit [Oscillospiraceae bacterium]|nr:ATP-dependent Clp protease proteolytic subunit [Oscillospiraceae bacterium]